jgi:hypothetical protein
MWAAGLVRSVIAGFTGLVLGGLAGRAVARHRASRRDRGSPPAVGALAVGFTVLLVVVTCGRAVVVGTCRVRVEDPGGKTIAPKGVNVPVYLADGAPYRGTLMQADDTRSFSWFANGVRPVRISSYVATCTAYFPGPPPSQWS